MFSLLKRFPFTAKPFTKSAATAKALSLPRLETLEARWNPAARVNGPLMEAMALQAPCPSITFVDSQLLDSLPRQEFENGTFFALDPTRDLVDQITQGIQGQSGLQAVRVITHGVEGGLVLGGTTLDRETLVQRSWEISQWKDHLAAGADILLYGCQVASNAAGKDFARELARLTHADVAASTNPTGAEGDTTLEFATGLITSGIQASQSAWRQSGITLNPPTITSPDSREVVGGFRIPFTATGSPTPTFSVNPLDLPKGVVFDAKSARLSSSPTEIIKAGTYSIRVEATNTDGTAKQTFSLVVKASTLEDPNPSEGNGFGHEIFPLANGNIVVSAPWDDGAGTDTGAVYLFNGKTGQLISTLRGKTEYDQLGSEGIQVLNNGNFVVLSPFADNGPLVDAGALTWIDGNKGLNGQISSTNSLVGSSALDQIGKNDVDDGRGIVNLTNGNYVIVSPFWDNGSISNAGAVTWASGTTPIVGTVSSANSLVGSSLNDQLGAALSENQSFGGYGSAITPLPGGNYVVSSPNWDRGLITDAGAVTWGNGATGVKGTVSETNSLVGSSKNDHLGGFSSDSGSFYGGSTLSNSVSVLKSGDFVVPNPSWDNGTNVDVGAVTWLSGTKSTSGEVSSRNSLIGSTGNDRVGARIDLLKNGNFLICSPNWSNGANAKAGAVTWCSGTQGIIGVVSADNSVVGSSSYDLVGSSPVVELTNGNLVVSSQVWNLDDQNYSVGAVTWMSGTSATNGAVSSTNSLVGSTSGDNVGSQVIALKNGNFVVISSFWDNGTISNAGAVTWCDGTRPTNGLVSSGNSLVGATAGDSIGTIQGGYFSASSPGIQELTNGNYLIVSPTFDNGTLSNVGAVTWCDGAKPLSGFVGSQNSLIGSHKDDQIGIVKNPNDSYGYSSPLMNVISLSNGNFVVGSPLWDNGTISNAGAVTWGDGTRPLTGELSSSNSLVGSADGDQLSYVETPNYWYNSVKSGLFALPSGNFVVCSPEWNNGSITNAGAVTWVDGTKGITGAIDSSNSLIGSSKGDSIGDSSQTILKNGNFIVVSSGWDNGSNSDAGSVTWMDGKTGLTGEISSSNSLVGATVGDGLGVSSGYYAMFSTITELPNGNFVIINPNWDNGSISNAGSVTLGFGNQAITGMVSSTNSLIGSQSNDFQGTRIEPLVNGHFVVVSSSWDNGPIEDAGALTWSSGTRMTTGVVGTENSLVGETHNQYSYQFQEAPGLNSYLISNDKKIQIQSAEDWIPGPTDRSPGVKLQGYLVQGVSSSYQIRSSSAIQNCILVQGILPEGLTLDNHGLISGIPKSGSEGYYHLNFQVTSNPGLTFEQNLTLVILPNRFVNPNPSAQDGFGSTILPLENGNVAITSPGDDKGGQNAGAVYLYDGLTGKLISSITGASKDDAIGSGGLIALSGSNFLISSPSWHNGTATDVGAVTWVNGVSGLSGVVGSSNSLVGSSANDQVGYLPFYNYFDPTPTNIGITILPNGNYLVRSPNWDNGSVSDVGAVTWGSGTTGICGVVGSANSLTGTTKGDLVGNGGITLLKKGNYLVQSPDWTNNDSTSAGAVTWGDGNQGIKGTVSEANSLVSNGYYDRAGGTVVALENGNYVVVTSHWGYSAGAVTWGDGTMGISGLISEANSLVGGNVGDELGSAGYDYYYGGYQIGVKELPNGNVVIRSPSVDHGGISDTGSITWMDGKNGINGIVSDSNSFFGGSSYDRLGSSGILIVGDSNYLISCAHFSQEGSYYNGSVTWAPGDRPVLGSVSSDNSLIGSRDYDSFEQKITVLKNGNYLVSSPYLDGENGADLGAVTWASGNSGITGVISSANSLIGSHESDFVGERVFALSNGNFVVATPKWDLGGDNGTDVGAVTWGNGATGITGLISSANSLIGSPSTDGNQVGSGGITELPNGHFVVLSPSWDNSSGGTTVKDVGAVTWMDGTKGLNGIVSPENSLVGSSERDQVGQGGIVTLTNGNYVILSPNWNNGSASSAGAVTWAKGGSGITGLVSTVNSLVGSSRGDYLGGIPAPYSFPSSGVLPLPNGNFVVISSEWDNGTVPNAGAVTWGNGNQGITGVVSSSNSLVGNHADDRVGTMVSKGRYSETDDVVPNLVKLSNGNFVIGSANWDNGSITDAGALTWCNGTSPTSGTISSENSLVGSSFFDKIGQIDTKSPYGGGASNISPLSSGDYVVLSSSWDNYAATDAGAITFGSGTKPLTGIITRDNSLIATQSYSYLGSGGIVELKGGAYATLSPDARNQAASWISGLTWSPGGTGPRGVFSEKNSLIGPGSLQVNQSGQFRSKYYTDIMPLSSGNLIGFFTSFSDGTRAAGAVPLLSGNRTYTGSYSISNSLLGTSPRLYPDGSTTPVLDGNHDRFFQTLADTGVAFSHSLSIGLEEAPLLRSANSVTFQIGKPGTFLVAATANPAPTYSVTSGKLPVGVTLDSVTGVLSGTPSASGVHSFTISASNGVGSPSTQTFNLTVSGGPQITSPASASFTVGKAATFQVVATGASGIFDYSIKGTLPSGITFSKQGLFSGTPDGKTGGSYSLVITATSSDGQSTTQDFTLTVNQAPLFSSANKTTFEVGKSGTFTLTATGFPAPTFAVKTGTLPEGLSLTSAGVLSGTPKAGSGKSYAITFVATNGIGSDATQDFTLTVNQAPLFSSANKATFEVGKSGTFTLTATGFPAPTFAVKTGTLPEGLSLTSAGVLSGTPKAGSGKSYAITFVATNGIGSDATQDFTLTVNQAPLFSSANKATFEVGKSGTFTLTATGFPAPTFAVKTGTLPEGLSLTSAGVLSGTPKAGSGKSYAITFVAANGIGTDATQDFTLTVNQAPLFSSANKATFEVGKSGTFTLTATGFPAPTFAVKTGTLPEGLSLTSAGVLSGTPKAGSGKSYAITFVATNGIGTDATQDFTLTVNQAPLFSSANKATFEVGKSGTFTLTATGFPAPTFAVKTGTLPEGLSLTSAGVLSGTPKAGTGNLYAITFVAMNGIGTDATQDFTLSLSEGPAITSSGKIGLEVGKFGSYLFTTTGFPRPVFKVLSGDLPAGVALSADGILSGTPAAGTSKVYSFKVSATNGIGSGATQDVQLTVGSAPTFTSVNQTTFEVGKASSFSLAAKGSPAPTFTIKTGTLPEGLTLTAAGILSGNPKAGTGKTYSLTFLAANGIGSDATQDFTLTVNQAPAFTSVANAAFEVGKAGGFTFKASGFPAPSFKVSAGTLPTGLKLSTDGILSGTPAAGTAKSYTLTIAATNGVGTGTTQAFTLIIGQPALITSANKATFEVGKTGSFQMTTTGFPAATYSVSSGFLPDGVTLSSSGLLSGKPATGQGKVYSFKVSANNGFGSASTQDFTLTVNQAPAFTSAANAAFEVGKAGGFTFKASGFPVPSFKVSAGTLPTGLKLSTDGILSGTPAAGTAKSYTLTIAATNGVGTGATQAFTLIVGQPALITSTNKATFEVGKTGTFQMTATGFPAPSYTVSTGTLPTGITLSSTGLLSGKATSGLGNTYSFKVSANNGFGSASTQDFTLTVNEAPVFTSNNTVTMDAGKSGSFSVIASGFPLPLLTLASGTLPKGITFDSKTGKLAGIPEMANPPGSYPLVFQAANGVGTSVTQSFSLVINNPTFTYIPEGITPILTTTNGVSNGISIWGAGGKKLGSINPYPGFTGKINTRLADINGDKVVDIITSPGSGLAPTIKIIDGRLLKESLSINAYDPTFTGGVSVAVGDTDGDGKLDLITSPGKGIPSTVKIFQTDGKLKTSFNESITNKNGVSVLVADLNADGKSEILTVPNAPSTSSLKVFDSKGTLQRTIQAFESAFTGGASVAVGDVDGNAGLEIIATSNSGRSTTVRVFGSTGSLLNEWTPVPGLTKGGTITIGDLDGDKKAEIIFAVNSGATNSLKVYDNTGKSIATTTPYAGTFTGGVSLAVVDTNGDGASEIVSAPGSGAGTKSEVKRFDSKLKLLDSLFAADATFTGGINLG